MGEKPVLVKREKNFAWILLNRPEKLNALNDEMLDLLEKALDELGSDDGVRCILIRGVGDKAFSAGADVSWLSELTPDEAKKASEKGHRVVRKIMELQKPVVAVVNGYALGGGCELALACDLRIASTKARFSQPEVKLGLIPGWGGTQLLPRLVGQAKAKEMIMFGGMLDAEEAYRIGLVNRVVPHESLDEEAAKVAEALASGPTMALSAAKRLVNLSLQKTVEDGFREEAAGFSVLFSTEDFREGVSAFMEKRKPQFKGR